MDIDDTSRLRQAHLGFRGLLTCFVVLMVLVPPVLAAKAMKPLEIKQRYTGVLEVLANGETERALTDLLELELSAVGTQKMWRYVDNLWRAKLHVIRDLLPGHDVALLMPIIVLHHDAYFRYSELDRRYLAQHSRTMAAELAEILAERSTDPAARAFAGWILTSFASYLWSPSNIGGAADLYYQAQLIDPGNELASQGLAAAWERSGDYGKAIESLTRAARLEPDNRELTLRLALCHLRWEDGMREAALAHLEALTRAETEAWVRSVAFQELARVQRASGDDAAAEATLRAGLEALPGDQQLSLQLASILDAQRRRNEASRVLDGIEILGWERESPRQTYDFWKPRDLTRVRAELHQSMTSGLDSLSAGLSGLSPSGGGG